MKIRIEQYEQAADEKVSIGGIKWLKKWDVCVQCDSREEAEALKARLAEPEQEPVAWMLEWSFNGEETGQRLYDDERHCLLDAQNDGGICRPLYTATPQRPWVGLTDEEVVERANAEYDPENFARGVAWASLKLKEKNGHS